ncbi:DUF134 domain-containing protein [Candidatus Gracilibacteria bacterium]|nr:DUF134 domain-containing protein [Candidatus Gracilibacteria bacterium]
MARPCKIRKVDESLKFTCFKPVGVDEESMQRVEIEPCELQAIKLSCGDELSQADSAKQMEISASTFNRVLKGAQKKIADALLNGKAIKVID